MAYLSEGGFNAYDLVRVSPNCHIVQDEFIEFDKQNLAAKLGTTSKGIAPTYSAKAARTGVLAKDVLDKNLLWDGKLYGSILCEGAQGVWLDIDHGNYPFVTSSHTLPYAACGIGFPPQKIRHIWGAAKAYDTRSGEDPLFPATLLDDPDLLAIANLGKEFGVTTGRRRKVRWLDLDLLIKSINLTGTTHVVISKCDVLNEAGRFKFYFTPEDQSSQTLITYLDCIDFYGNIKDVIKRSCPLVQRIYFSYTPEGI